MQVSVPLASDIFSYSWLSNSIFPFDGLVDPHIESVYSFYGNSEFNSIKTNSDNSVAESQSFNFDPSIIHSPFFIVHADELFSDGILRPVFFGPTNLKSCNTLESDPIQTKHGSSFSSKSDSPRTVEIHQCFLRRWRKSTRRNLVEFFRYVNKLCHKVRYSRKSMRIGDIGKTDWKVKSLSNSQPSSPIPITNHPIGNLHDHENSIYEAVIHCKRSIGK
ncbi:PREDICTED: probable membrane-associated kinase regulator 6 [Lupinus angustifolius]|uniref:probable membrane-associated kinase regulator 6 n=1 Tax=Lupinus angustifolius TaxID=3871 RepID=UPI00092ED6D2|nr:PREDICTED: probable membrane-associated kinase regulator 6 [Lupinus angustifolius]